MKKLIIILTVFLLGLSGWPGFCQDIEKSMALTNPYLEYSDACKILNGSAYITITGIHSYSSEKLWKDLKIISDNDIKKIIILMNSGGGDAEDGLAMADMLRMFRIAHPETTIVIEGLGRIMSAAILLYIQGTKRICSPTTTFLIHPAKVWEFQVPIKQSDQKSIEKDLENTKAQLEHMKKIKDLYSETVLSRTKLTKEKLEELIQKDSYFWPDQAKEWGFVDEIK